MLMWVGLFFYMSDGDPFRMVMIAGCMVAAFLAMLYTNQENMLYLNNNDPQFKRPQDNPPGMKLRNPKERGMEYSDHYLNTPDGCCLHAWMIPAQEGVEDAPTIIFF